MHYIELDDNGAFHGVYPLNEEIAGTAFYDGVLEPLFMMECWCRFFPRNRRLVLSR